MSMTDWLIERIDAPDASAQDHPLTDAQFAALAAFRTLTERADLDGQRILAVLNRDGRPVAHHNFSKPGPPSPGSDPGRYWRGRTGEVNLSVAT